MYVLSLPLSNVSCWAAAGDTCVLRANVHCHLLADHTYPTSCSLVHTMGRAGGWGAEAHLPPPAALPLVLVGQHCPGAGLTPNGHIPHLMQLVYRHTLHSQTCTVMNTGTSAKMSTATRTNSLQGWMCCSCSIKASVKALPCRNVQPKRLSEAKQKPQGLMQCLVQAFICAQ